VRARLVERLASFMSGLPSHYQVPDASVTVRDGRYVIPVRREGRGEVGGIVHDESATGATLFVEPPLAVEMMNRLRELEAEESREVLRILRELTDRLRPLQPELLASLDALVALDSLYARARYARAWTAIAPGCCRRGPRTTRWCAATIPSCWRGRRGGALRPADGRRRAHAAHLRPQHGREDGAAEGHRADLAPGAERRDPAGGAGEHGSPSSARCSPTSATSRASRRRSPPFQAHLKNLREALEGPAGRSLVLTDEAGSGTDPVEGGALAGAVLVELTRRSCFTVATTHLGQLKLLATVERGVVNASLQFDAERLQPTYRLVKGVPGRSYGLAIARRLGLHDAVLAGGGGRHAAGERDIARLLLELEAKEQRLDQQTLETERLQRETAALRAQLEERQRELKQQEKDAERRARQQARDLLLKARAEVEEAIAQVRQAPPPRRWTRPRAPPAAAWKRPRTARRSARRASGAGRVPPRRSAARPRSSWRRGCACASSRWGATGWWWK
jgi:DNA mismatch repair protein MutS2